MFFIFQTSGIELQQSKRDLNANKHAKSIPAFDVCTAQPPIPRMFHLEINPRKGWRNMFPISAMSRNVRFKAAACTWSTPEQWGCCMSDIMQPRSCCSVWLACCGNHAGWWRHVTPEGFPDKSLEPRTTNKPVLVGSELFQDAGCFSFLD